MIFFDNLGCRDFCKKTSFFILPDAKLRITLMILKPVLIQIRVFQISRG